MKRLCLSAVIELPEDVFAAADVFASVKTPWNTALQNLKASGVKFEHSQDVMEVKTKATRKPRKKQEDTVRLVETPPQDAA